LAILFGGIAFLTSIFSSWNLYQHMAEEYRSRGKAIAHSLADIGTSVLDSQSAPVAEAILAQYFETRGVVYIIIRDKDGRIKYDTFSGRIPVELSEPHPSNVPIIRDRNIRDIGLIFDIVEPIKSGGTVQVGMDQSWIKSIAWRSFLIQQLMVFLAFVATVFFAYSIVRRISLPLNKLARYAEDLSQSEFSEPSPRQSRILQIGKTKDDEVGHLAMAVIQLENQLIKYIRNLRETTSIKEKIESELKVARDIQMNMVPRDFPLFPNHPELNVSAYIEPAKAVGGDFYDFILLEDNRKLAFVIGDVSGKGIPAALFMAMSTTLIKATASQIQDPATVIQKVNKKLCNENKSRLFVTTFYGVLDLSTGVLRYCVAGHNPPYRVSGPHLGQIVSAPGLPMGIDDTATYDTVEIQILPGDTLFVYTDGVTECRNIRGEFYKESGLETQLTASMGQSPAAVCERVVADLARFSRGTAQSDDITMFALQWQGQMDVSAIESAPFPESHT
jgi:sigma-B regulation protein RsbU (phosphoserine phosphatase)